jgi:hypothetical protein
MGDDSAIDYLILAGICAVLVQNATEPAMVALGAFGGLAALSANRAKLTDGLNRSLWRRLGVVDE